MCPYCGDNFVAHILHEEQGEDWSPGVSAYVMDGNLHVDVDGEDYWEFEAQVNYCPMCGRDIREGDAK